MSKHVGPIDSLIADFRLNMKRLKEAPLNSFQAVNEELYNNIYPSVIAITEQIFEVDEVIQEIVEHHESYISIELAGQISETIAIGFALIKVIKELKIENQLAKKRLSDLAGAFEKSAELTMMGVSDATPEDDEDDEDKDGEEAENSMIATVQEIQETPDA